MVALTTPSGSRVEMLTSVDIARAFDRCGPSDYHPNGGDGAWGALEGARPMVPVGVLGAVRPLCGQAWIAVAPERRLLAQQEALLHVDAPEWQYEELAIRSHYDTFGDRLPAILSTQLDSLPPAAAHPVDGRVRPH